MVEHPHVVCALAAFASIIFIIAKAKNPAKIPLRKLVPRWMAGLGIFWAVWSCIALLVCLLVELTPWTKNVPEYHLFASVAIGLLLPHAARVADLGIKRRDDKWGAAGLANVAIGISEITYRYFQKIINREERKASYRYLVPQYGDAIDRLFELHLLEIIGAAKLNGNARKFLFLISIRSRAVRFKLLIRYLGVTTLSERLEHVAREPLSVLPTWLPAAGNRRHRPVRRVKWENHLPERRSSGGRRQTDSADVRAALLAG